MITHCCTGSHQNHYPQFLFLQNEELAYYQMIPTYQVVRRKNLIMVCEIELMYVRDKESEFGALVIAVNFYLWQLCVFCEYISITRTEINYKPIFLSNTITVKSLTVISLTSNNNCYILN